MSTTSDTEENREPSRLSVIGAFLRLIKVCISLSVFCLVIGLTGIVGGYFYFAHDLPNIRSLSDYKPALVSEVYAHDGTKVGEFWEQRRFLASRDDIPDMLANAFIAAEDARFYEHSGIDPQGIMRALWKDVQAGDFVQGASTITQQITRSLALSRERRLERKIREVILATRLERNLSKDQILTLYLNEIYLGNRAYGVRAAADNYFHKTLDALNIAEMAMLAGLPRSPATDNPVRNPEAAKRRQEYVLNRMQIEGFITEAQHQEAKAAPLQIFHAQLDKDYNQRFTPYFTEHVRRILVEQYGHAVVYRGGLQIHTTVDPAAYHAAEMALRNGIETVDQRTRRWNGTLAQVHTAEERQAVADATHRRAVTLAGRTSSWINAGTEEEQSPLLARHNYQAVVTGRSGKTIDVLVGRNSGHIMADDHQWARHKLSAGDIVEVRPLTDEDTTRYILTQTPKLQGAIMSMDAATGFVRAMIGGYDFADSEFNRATQGLRQPGSSFKPFVYAAALDKGFRYHTPVADSPVAYQVGEREIWSPKNAGGKFSGVGPFMDHITYSRNIPTVKIGHAIGLDYLTAFARKLGLSSPLNKYLSMSLGANGAYLHELVRAYATFPNLGHTPTQTFVTKIQDPDGNIVFEHTPPQHAALTAPEKLPDDESTITHAGLRSNLWSAAQSWIQRDDLALDPEEQHVLYGNRIPEGYTITPQTAHLVTGLLSGVVSRGTGRRVASLGKAIAGKTGTTNDNTDTWFIGYTPDVVTGVWVGYDTIKRIGRGEEGGRTAAPIWREYMAATVSNWDDATFATPPGLEGAALAGLTGGSAAYWQHGIDGSIAKEAEEIEERRMHDRAVDFFEQDMDFEEM